MSRRRRRRLPPYSRPTSRQRLAPFTLNHLSAGVRPFFFFFFSFFSWSFYFGFFFSCGIFNLRQIDEQQSRPFRPLFSSSSSYSDSLFLFLTCRPQQPATTVFFFFFSPLTCKADGAFRSRLRLSHAQHTTHNMFVSRIRATVPIKEMAGPRSLTSSHLFNATTLPLVIFIFITSCSIYRVLDCFVLLLLLLLVHLISELFLFDAQEIPLLSFSALVLLHFYSSGSFLFMMSHRKKKSRKEFRGFSFHFSYGLKDLERFKRKMFHT